MVKRSDPKDLKTVAFTLGRLDLDDGARLLTEKCRADGRSSRGGVGSRGSMTAYQLMLLELAALHIPYFDDGADSCPAIERLALDDTSSLQQLVEAGGADSQDDFLLLDLQIVVVPGWRTESAGLAQALDHADLELATYERELCAQGPLAISSDDGPGRPADAAGG